jgi:hypothetical protein
MFCGRELFPEPGIAQEGRDLRVVIELRLRGEGADLDFPLCELALEGRGGGYVRGGEGGVKNYGPGGA